MPRPVPTPEERAAQKERRRQYAADYYQRNRAKLDAQHEARRHGATPAPDPMDNQWTRVEAPVQ